MRSAICTLALALVLVGAVSAQTPPTGPARPVGSLPTFAPSRINVTNALGNIFGIRGLLPSFRDNGQVTGGVPNAVLNGVPDPANSANYLKGFGFRRP